MDQKKEERPGAPILWPAALKAPRAQADETDADRLPILVIVGPTASGKSELAARLGALLPGEVISADSVQLYESFDIGAGKPSADEQALCPHHLLDVCEATQAIDASRFAALADEAIAAVTARGKVPIVCGGTFLWVRALLFGLAEAPPGDESLRRAHQAIAERDGRDALHKRLAEVDPEAAARLHPNDFVRVSRALEVFELTGKKLSTLQAQHGFKKERYQATLLGIDWPRDVYNTRVETRVRRMLQAGWVEEVRELIASGQDGTRAMESVGYRQVRDAIASGQIDEGALVTEISQVTRIFARRQRTWLRDREVQWLPPSILDSGLEELACHLSGQRSG